MARARAGDYAVLDGTATQASAANMAHGTVASIDDLYPNLGIDSTPRFVGGIVLGAVATLIALKAAGFRFSFGVGVGG
jgi:hypothetical protein